MKCPSSCWNVFRKHALVNCTSDADWANSTSQNSKTHLVFRMHTFWGVKKEKILDLEIFNWIGKTTKMLQWIPNTIVNTSILF